MALGQLSNCARCDVLFLKATRDVCPKCHLDVEKDYDLCSRFLRKRENRGSTIHQVSEATGVSIKQITRFVKEGRISIEGNPNMGYPCENCGILIRHGNICDTCAASLKREITQQLDVDKRLVEDAKRHNAVGYQRKAGEN